MLAAFSITPLGSGDPGDSVAELVAEAVRIVRASGLPNDCLLYTSPSPRD